MALPPSIRGLVAAVGLAALVWLAFGGALDCGFVCFDDNEYVVSNPRLADGFSAAGLRWAFTTGHAANWHPLTWLSYFVDFKLYGLERPGGYHLTNLLIHVLNALLLFVVAAKWTKRPGMAWLVAAVWAIHPLRAESVVWISERKDVLAMFFGLLALVAHGAGPEPRTWRRQAVVALCFAASLMSKPMWVTLPFLLLLLDYWPLRRRPGRGVWPLLREKTALFALSAGSCAATFLVQQAGRAVIPGHLAPWSVRIANACVAYVEYVRLLFWPFRLAVFYPHQGVDLPGWRIGLSVAILVLLTAGAVRYAARNPGWLSGWLWYLGSLVPMIGLVQVGAQAWADRYTYLPHIGLLLALAWGVAETIPSAWRRAGVRRGATVLAGILLAGLVFLSRRQTATWRDSETLFLHALANTKNNARTEMNLGAWYLEVGRLEEAQARLLRSLAIQPRRNEARYNLGNCYLRLGRPDEAIREYRAMLVELPEQHLALNNLSRVLANEPGADRQQLEEALDLARRAVACAPEGRKMRDTLALAHWKLGKSLFAEGRAAEAREHWEHSLEAKPAANRAAIDLADLDLAEGRKVEAIRGYRAVLADLPDHAGALNNLAWLLASDSAADPAAAAEALALARRAVANTDEPRPEQLDTLALALAATGDFAAAATTARRALDLAEARADAKLAGEIALRLARYLEGQPIK